MNAANAWAGAVLALSLAAPGPARAETHTVVIDAMQFQPAALVVKRGDTIVWDNKDLVPHTATAAGRFDSGQIDPGKKWSWTVRDAGRIEYVCTYHPGMKASVTAR